MNKGSRERVLTLKWAGQWHVGTKIHSLGRESAGLRGGGLCGGGFFGSFDGRLGFGSEVADEIEWSGRSRGCGFGMEEFHGNGIGKIQA